MFQKETIVDFENLFESLKEFHPLILNKNSALSYSGGKDSTYLVAFYYYLYINKSIPEIQIFHLDHSIRENKQQEEEIFLFISKYFKNIFFYKKNIPKLSKRLSIGFEECGRKIRYHLLKKKFKNSYISTAHHLEDYLESLLIHLIRGGGKKSYQTLPIWNGEIFRPLMKLGREKIDNFFKIEKEWKYFEDESNFSDLYLRNRIRKNISSKLIQEGINTKKLYENFHEDYFEEATLEKNSFLKISNSSLNNRFYLKELIDLHLKILGLNPINRSLLKEIHSRIDNNSLIQIENSELYFWKSLNSDLFLIPKNSKLLQKPKKLDNNLFFWNNKKFYLEEKEIVITYFPSAKIQFKSHTKEVSEIFRENEIPFYIRENLPIIQKENKIVKILLSLFDNKLKDIQINL